MVSRRKKTVKNASGVCSIEAHVKYVTKVLHLAVKYYSLWKAQRGIITFRIWTFEMFPSCAFFHLGTRLMIDACIC